MPAIASERRVPLPLETRNFSFCWQNLVNFWLHPENSPQVFCCQKLSKSIFCHVHSLPHLLVGVTHSRPTHSKEPGAQLASRVIFAPSLCLVCKCPGTSRCATCFTVTNCITPCDNCI